jgi:hypothetical protein
MASERRHRYDDRDGIDDLQVHKSSGGGAMLPVWLAVGGVAFLLLACSCGIGVVGVVAVAERESHQEAMERVLAGM